MTTKYDRFQSSAKRDGSLEIGTTTINYSGYGYGQQYAGMTHVYGYDGEHMFDYIVTYHRARVIIDRLQNGTWWSIDSDIRDNYAHNGYMTRVGLERAASSAKRKARIAKIAESHGKFGMVEGKDGHDIRVRYRNL